MKRLRYTQLIALCLHTAEANMKAWTIIADMSVQGTSLIQKVVNTHKEDKLHHFNFSGDSSVLCFGPATIGCFQI